MMNPSTTIEIPALLTNKILKKLSFNPEGLTIERPTTFVPPDFVAAQDILAFRYGVKWIRGYMFAVGRRYFIEIKDTSGDTRSIKFKSYYGFKRETYSKIWSRIIEELWKNYFHALFDHYFNLYKSNQTFEFTGVKFLFEGIGWENNFRILWEDIALSNYRTYFVIHPKQNPKENKSLNFANDWNAYILQCLLKKIIEEQKQNK